MSQIWVYSHDLIKKEIILSDVGIQTYDCITPQKTTFKIKKNNNIISSDIVLIKEENKKDFIGIVDTHTITDISEVSIYPLEQLFDNDLELDNLDGTVDVVTYLKNQIDRNFINTDDTLMKLPFIYENQLTEPVYYKTIVDSGNFLDIINDIYLHMGVFMEYVPYYSSNKLSAIKIIFKNVVDNEIRKIRYDNPQIVDVSYEFSNTTCNKVTVAVQDKKYKIYLREDNELTSNPNDKYRIKKVLNKNIEFTETKNGNDEPLTDDEIAEAIIVMAQKELQNDAFGYKITFEIMISPYRKWYYRQVCIFTSEDKVFKSLVTKIEYLNDKYLRITLGAFRTKLTEKIQKLMKPKEKVGNTLAGITVSNAFGQYLFWFEKDTDGNLYVCSDNYSIAQLEEMFELDELKNLYVNYKDTQKQSLSIDLDGNLVGGY